MNRIQDLEGGMISDHLPYLIWTINKLRPMGLRARNYNSRSFFKRQLSLVLQIFYERTPPDKCETATQAYSGPAEKRTYLCRPVSAKGASVNMAALCRALVTSQCQTGLIPTPLRRGISVDSR